MGRGVSLRPWTVDSVAPAVGLTAWVLILSVLQIRERRPKQSNGLAKVTQTLRSINGFECWCFMSAEALPTAPQLAPAWATGPHSIWLHPDRHIC